MSAAQHTPGPQTEVVLANGWGISRWENYWGKSTAWFAVDRNPDGTHNGFHGPYSRKRDALARAALAKVSS